jgi:7,8-dihydropterin-6-yl-methyl-4-(beta-D-ribofuranosyl)aminobenzene 5'-phosphate synthase
MNTLNLQEIDSVEATVIIDNELDPLSPPAPNTVQIAGNLGTIGMNSKHKLTDRGGACKEMRMEDICCSAHGLSILVVR